MFLQGYAIDGLLLYTTEDDTMMYIQGLVTSYRKGFIQTYEEWEKTDDLAIIAWFK